MAQMFLKLGDAIKGETTDENHTDWMEITSFSHGLSQPVSSASGTGGRTGSGASFSDLVVSKVMDSSSPDILHHCAAGKLIKKVEMHCCQSSGADAEAHVFLSYELGNCIISSYSPSGSSEGGEKPSDTFTISYGTISMAYTPLDDEHASGSESKRGWDVQKNKTL